MLLKRNPSSAWSTPASSCWLVAAAVAPLATPLLAAGNPQAPLAVHGNLSPDPRQDAEHRRHRLALEQPLRVAQTSPQLVIEKAISAAPGGAHPLPVRLAEIAAGGGNHLVMYRTPNWLTLREAESVSAGVWVIRPASLAKVELVVAADAPVGPHEFQIALLSRDGKVISESKIAVNVAQATAAPAAPARDAPKNWTDVLGKPPTAAAPAPSTTAAAPAPKPAAVAAKPAPGGQKSEAELVSYAKFLVRECTTCHSLYGQDVGIPLMIGLTKDRFLDTMDLYRKGKRDNPAMRNIAQSLDDDQTLALALYLGRIKPPPPPSGQSSPAAGAETAIPAEAAIAKRASAGAEEKVERWTKRGQQMLELGDIAQARLLLERASEYGSARAALLMANSFDPNTLPWRPGMGLEAEPIKARQWYIFAQKLGAGEEAERRLSELSGRQ